MLENEKNTLIFWSELELDNFPQWRFPTTTTTSTMPIHASGGPINGSESSTIKATKSPTTTKMPSQMDLYKGFCYSQPLAYCANCEPMCIIQTNCLEHGVCYANIMAKNPDDPVYWTPLINVCCGICNFKCPITRSHPLFVGPLAPSTQSSTTTTLPPPISPTLIPIKPIKTLPEKTTLSSTKSSTSTTSTSSTTTSTTTSSTTSSTTSTTTTTTTSTTISTTTSAETSTAIPTAMSITSTLMTTTSALISTIPNTSGSPVILENVTLPDLSITVITSTNQTLAGDVLAPDKSLLTYILPITGVLFLGLIIFGIIYRKKLKTRLNSFKSKYSTTNSERPSSTGSSSEEEVDITDVAITDLWERIKNDDNYNSRHSQPGAFHRAPLAAVLNRDSSDS